MQQIRTDWNKNARFSKCIFVANIRRTDCDYYREMSRLIPVNRSRGESSKTKQNKEGNKEIAAR